MDEQPLDRTTAPQMTIDILIAERDEARRERDALRQQQSFPDPPALMNLYLNMEKERDEARRERDEAHGAWRAHVARLIKERDEAVAETARVAARRIGELQAQVARLIEERDGLQTRHG